MPCCFMFDLHTAARPALRALDKAGSRIPINNAMIAMTTSSSMSVKPERGRFANRFMTPLQYARFQTEPSGSTLRPTNLRMETTPLDRIISPMSSPNPGMHIQPRWNSGTGFQPVRAGCRGCCFEQPRPSTPYHTDPRKFLCSAGFISGCEPLALACGFLCPTAPQASASGSSRSTRIKRTPYQTVVAQGSNHCTRLIATCSI